MIPLLIAGIAFFSPWGKVFQYDVLSVNVVLGFGLLFFGTVTGRVYYGFKVYHYLFFLFMFNLMAAMATLYHHGFGSELTNAIKFFYYAITTLICTAIPFNNKKMEQILIIYFNSAAVMCLFSLLDYYEFVNIPGFNDWMNDYLVEGYETGKGVSGPFDTRTGIASYLSTVFPIGVFCFFARTGLSRIFYGAATLIVVLTGLLSLSRGLYPAIALVFLAYTVKALQSRGMSRSLAIWRTLIFFSIFMLGAYFLIRTSSQQLHSIFVSRVSSLHIGEVSSSDADMLRIWTFQKTVLDLMDSPLGMGFSSVVLWTGESKNTHNILTQVLRVAGFLGLIFFFTFLTPYIRKAWSQRGDPLLNCLNAIFVSFFIYGMTHNILGTLLFWIFLGLAMNRLFNPHYGSGGGIWNLPFRIVFKPVGPAPVPIRAATRAPVLKTPKPMRPS